MHVDPPALKSRVNMCKIATIVLGLLILILGLFSHFQSAWVKTDVLFSGFSLMAPYKFCEIDGVKNCPKISMERYFVAMIIISFILSIIGLVASLFEDMKKGILKHVDLGYHVVIAVLLLIAAIVYIISAAQIYDMTKLIDNKGVNFRRGEKLAAGSLTILQSVLYGVTALFIFKQ